MVELDGSTGEGGGQVLRTALALSVVTGRSLAIRHIRAKRPKPGLMRQHLACVEAAMQICDSRAAGAELGSQELTFEPGAVRAGDYICKVGTAGSCTLVLQTVLPALMLAPGSSTVTVCGGTHNPMAPPFHFIERSFAPLLRRLGVPIQLVLKRAGFYPAGGGELVASVGPAPAGLVPFDLLERGALVEAYAECLAPALPQRVAGRELHALGAALGWSGEQLRTPVVRQNEGPGNALMATMRFAHVAEVFTAFGERGVSAENVAAQVVKQVRAYEASEGVLGVHLADQWLLPLALAVSATRRGAVFTCTELTGHAMTNMETIAAFLPVRFAVESGSSAARVAIEIAEGAT